MYYKDFQNFIMEIAFQTTKMFGITDEEKIQKFYKNLEICALEEILNNKEELNTTSTTFKHSNNYVPSFISSALIASGISKDGTIPVKSSYVDIEPVKNNDDIKEYAIKRYEQIERRMFTKQFVDNVKGLCSNCIQHNKIEIERLMLGLFAFDDSYLGYCDINMDDGFTPYLASALETHLDVLASQGLEGSLCYRILDSMSDIKHYDMNTKEALIDMATIDYELSTGKRVSKERIEKAKLSIASAKEMNPEIIEKYEDLFNNRLIVSGKNSSKTRRI